VNTWVHRPAPKSHTRTVLSMPVDTHTVDAGAGLAHTPNTLQGAPVWPESVCTRRPVASSHTLRERASMHVEAPAQHDACTCSTIWRGAD